VLGRPTGVASSNDSTSSTLQGASINESGSSKINIIDNVPSIENVEQVEPATADNTHVVDPDPVDTTIDEDSGEGPDQESKGVVMENYLETVFKRLCGELNPPRHTPMKDPWLHHFREAHDWRIRSFPAKSICTKLGMQIDGNFKVAYQRDIFVWLPDIRWGSGCSPRCPNAGCGRPTVYHCWRDNHFGRRVSSLHSNYLIISRIYRCDHCKDQRREKYKSMGYNPTSN
jgi:hypothetical protein